MPSLVSPAAFGKNVIERLTRHAEQLGDLHLGPIQRRHYPFAQKFAGGA
jgi:hypothetical protein